MALAFASHLFLDMMAADDGRPSAVPLFWPLSDRMVTLPFTPFSAIRLDPGVDGFVQSLLSAHNANALMWEFGIVLLVVSLTSVARRARSQPARPPHTDPIRRTTRINPPRQYSE